jgi:sorting and assembly machinery component 37
MIELHVWGPALGLPSIDPECLAAIAYLSCALSNEEWTVIVDTTSVALPPRMSPASLLG